MQKTLILRYEHVFRHVGRSTQKVNNDSTQIYKKGKSYLKSFRT